MYLDLLEIRKAKGLKQSEVAECSNISQHYYSKIEHGTRRPSVDVAKKIAEVLEFDWTNFYK